MIAIGIGCRRDTPATAIESLILQAVAQVATASAFGMVAASALSAAADVATHTAGANPVIADTQSSTPVMLGAARSMLPHSQGAPLLHDRLQAALFTVEDKADESGLIEAAHNLNLSLTFLPRSALRAQITPTPSPRAQAEFGIPSVAEAAALAGAGPAATLIVPRLTAHGVTCAIARRCVMSPQL